MQLDYSGCFGFELNHRDETCRRPDANKELCTLQRTDRRLELKIVDTKQQITWKPVVRLNFKFC